MTDQYSALYDTYQWLIPTQFNIAQACLQRWASTPLDSRRTAVLQHGAPAPHARWTYARLAETAGKLANGLLKMGAQPGDRIVLSMEQRPEAAAACLAVLAVGAVLVPLSTRKPQRDLVACLRDAAARIAIVDASHAPALRKIQSQCPQLGQIVGLAYEDEATLPWRSLLARQEAGLQVRPMPASSPALLLYDSGPRGLLLPHSALIGALPGFVATQNWFPRPGDVFWTPLPWTDPRGLLAGLLPTLYFGQPIVAGPDAYHPLQWHSLMTEQAVTNVLVEAADLPNLLTTLSEPAETPPPALRALAVEGRGLTADLIRGCRQSLGLEPALCVFLNEAGLILGDSPEKWPSHTGSLGRAIPGYELAALDETGRPAPAGTAGQLAVRRLDRYGHPNPAQPLAWWRNDAAYVANWRGDWWLTSLRVRRDAKGVYWPAEHNG